MPKNALKTADITPIKKTKESEHQARMRELLVLVGGENCADLSAADAVNHAAHLLNVKVRAEVLAGLLLLYAQENTPNDRGAALKKMLQRAGLSERSALRYHAVGRWLFSMPIETVRKFLSAPITKLEALTGLDPTELEDFMRENEKDPEGLMSLPKEELVRLVKKERKKTARAEGELVEVRAAAEAPGTPAAWTAARTKLGRKLAKQHGGIRLALEEFTMSVESIPTPPSKVHGNTLNRFDAEVRAHVEGICALADKMRGDILGEKPREIGGVIRWDDRAQ